MNSSKIPPEMRDNSGLAMRDGQRDIETISNSLASDVRLAMITAAFPDVALILNHYRQIIYYNEALLNLAHPGEEGAILGMRPGEVLSCQNLLNENNGCGTTSSCRLCGTMQAIQQCLLTGQQSKTESRITIELEGQIHALDLEVVANPFIFKDETLVMLVIRDISDTKRRQLLEQIFFHDILNTAAGLNGLLYALESPESDEEYKNTIAWARKAGNELVEELLSQRTLLSAESGELHLNITRCQAVQLMEEVASYLSYHQIAENKKITIDPLSHGAQFESDPQLVKRVLINLVKNALEAIPAGESVRLRAKNIDRTLLFSVNNPGELSEDVKLQIFQRSFSTKGPHRGIGSFSIKLLTTTYLKGRVWFESEAENGTTFFVEIPLCLKPDCLGSEQRK